MDVEDERARCIGLCRLMAEHLEAQAAEIRARRTFKVRQIWPWKLVDVVTPGAQMAADAHDTAAGIIRNIMKGIDSGLLPDEACVGPVVKS